MLFEFLRRGAAEVPNLSVVETADGSLTYRDCLLRSEALASGLSGDSIERHSCLIDDVGELIALLGAASLVGTESCIYPDRLDANGVSEFAHRFDHDTVITDRCLGLSSPRVVSLDDLTRSNTPLPPAGDRSPLLVLTTGTTGQPRGVRHDWATLAGAVRHPDEHPGTRWLLTYNLNQFAGIQILLHVLASRATLVVAPSRHPRDVISAMREHEVTHASGTPTFWRLLLARLDDDTAAELKLEQITLGGEAVPEPLLRELARRFPRARTSQIYAATEFGSGVSVRDGRAGLPSSVLERGDDAAVRFRIVDGELHVRTRIGMIGYFRSADEAAEWRPTGDLVEVRGDRIHFVGRASEVINVGGVKVHPLPVEGVVSGLPGVELVHAYGRPNPIAGQIVAIDVVAQPGTDYENLRRAIQSACGRLPPAARPRLVRFVDQLEVRDNKVARKRAGAGL